jgi:hypothetical protein
MVSWTDENQRLACSGSPEGVPGRQQPGAGDMQRKTSEGKLFPLLPVSPLSFFPRLSVLGHKVIKILKEDVSSIKEDGTTIQV